MLNKFPNSFKKLLEEKGKRTLDKLSGVKVAKSYPKVKAMFRNSFLGPREDGET
jgi:hypothetical protein